MLRGFFRALLFMLPQLMFGSEGLKQREEDGKSNVGIGILLIIFGACFLFCLLMLCTVKFELVSFIACIVMALAFILATVIARTNVKKRREQIKQNENSVKTGAYTDEFEDCAFAYDTVKNRLLKLEPELKQKAFEQFLELNYMSEAEFCEYCEKKKNDPAEKALANLCIVLNVTAENGRVVFAEEPVAKARPGCSDYTAFFSALGYKVKFKKLKQNGGGVYYIKSI